jgi:hypothetical protein
MVKVFEVQDTSMRNIYGAATKFRRVEDPIALSAMMTGITKMTTVPFVIRI